MDAGAAEAGATDIDEELLLPSRITNIADPFVKRLAISVHSTNLPETFEQFFLENCEIFPNVSDDPNALGDGNVEGKEHDLEYTAVFEKYSKILADHLDAFRASEGVTEEAYSSPKLPRRTAATPSPSNSSRCCWRLRTTSISTRSW